MTLQSAVVNASGLWLHSPGGALRCGTDGLPLGGDVTGYGSRGAYAETRGHVVQASWKLMANITFGVCNTSASGNTSAQETITGESSAVYWLRVSALAATLAFLSLLTFVGNAMVLHAVRTERRLQTVSA
ncbi:hypothetical protein NP493_489g01000 [Ridgeia piscesae]|uniref:Uncharacterized protein n=1 Tax=Ridgeia piscesae TaxID=27915 RepID=A0AAD9KY17_RIDPI|nr:hypothetical protein NP493_489g01000 [Ridgeia piscesae]